MSGGGGVERDLGFGLVDAPFRAAHSAAAVRVGHVAEGGLAAQLSHGARSALKSYLKDDASVLAAPLDGLKWPTGHASALALVLPASQK